MIGHERLVSMLTKTKKQVSVKWENAYHSEEFIIEGGGAWKTLVCLLFL